MRPPLSSLWPTMIWPVAETDFPTITVEQAKALTEMAATAAEMAQARSDLRKVISELSLIWK